MGAAQIIMIVLFALGLGTTIAKHGQPKGNYSIGEHIIGITIYISHCFGGEDFGDRSI